MRRTCRRVRRMSGAAKANLVDVLANAHGRALHSAIQMFSLGQGGLSAGAEVPRRAGRAGDQLAPP
eukprot:4516883-Pyramimonas_sp.AAC.1